jgi:hypothetical protein
MAQQGMVKNKHDFIVSCRNRAERLWMQAKVLGLKRAYRHERARRRVQQMVKAGASVAVIVAMVIGAVPAQALETDRSGKVIISSLGQTTARLTVEHAVVGGSAVLVGAALAFGAPAPVLAVTIGSVLVASGWAGERVSAPVEPSVVSLLSDRPVETEHHVGPLGI